MFGEAKVASILGTGFFFNGFVFIVNLKQSSVSEKILRNHDFS